MTLHDLVMSAARAKSEQAACVEATAFAPGHYHRRPAPDDGAPGALYSYWRGRRVEHADALTMALANNIVDGQAPRT